MNGLLRERRAVAVKEDDGQNRRKEGLSSLESRVHYGHLICSVPVPQDSALHQQSPYRTCAAPDTVNPVHSQVSLNPCISLKT